MAKSVHAFAFCRDHGIFTNSNLFALGEGSSITTENCTVSCPACGASSEILPGTYENIGDRVNFLLDRSISKDALNALNEIIRKLQNKEIDEITARKEAEAITPAASKLFDYNGLSQESKVALISAAAMVIATLLQPRMAPSSPAIPQITINNTINIHQRLDDISCWMSDVSRIANKKPPIPQRNPKRK